MGARPSSFAKPEVVKAPARVWSDQQQAIFEWFEGSYKSVPSSHLVVRARAGTGKTSTIIEGINRSSTADSVLVCAFNKRIADDLDEKITRGSAEAKTLHGLGLATIRRHMRGMPVSKGTLRADYLTSAVCPSSTPRQIRRLVTELHTKGRDIMGRIGSEEELTTLALFHNLAPDDGWGIHTLEWVVLAAQRAIVHAAQNEPTYDYGVDFADMIFLPLAHNLLAKDYDLVVVDEAQDMTMAQLDMAQRSCNGRICVVGDDRQAIYSFRGADSGSLDRLKHELGAGELPLTLTYRCAQAVTREAQRLVKDIEAVATNPEGRVDEGSYRDMVEEAEPGDFILSRINAPLVTVTLQMIREGKRARMVGRDIGRDIKGIIAKLGCYDRMASTTKLLTLLDAWERKTTTRLAARGELGLVDRCHDQAATICALAQDVDTVGQLQDRCDGLFVDDNDVADTVVCSSVHKAKGLEADRVFILQESLYRRGVEPEEQNIEYVAITRAKTHLSRVMGVPGLGVRR